MFKRYQVVLAFAIICSSAAAIVDPAGRSLADAVEEGNFAAARALLDSGTNPDAAQPDGTTPLIWAAFHARHDIVQMLLDTEANATAQNRYGVQAINVACLNGDIDSAHLLVEAGANVNSRLPGGESVLHSASRSGNGHLVDYLLREGAEIDHRMQGGQTALMWAAAEGHAAVTDHLLEAGADPTAKSRHGFTPIHFAARAGHKQVVSRLLEAGVDVDAPLQWTGPGGFRSPRKQSSPLILAIENAQFELAVFLLDEGADPNDNRTGYAPLHTMTWVRKAHLGDSADPEPPNHGKLSSTDFLLELIQHGADVNLPVNHGASAAGRVGEKGATPFFLAADRADLEMMQLLVQHGADPHIPNVDGVTPLMVAAGLGRGPEKDEAGTQEEALAAVAYCIELGMDVNAVDANGETAMHGAAYGQWPDMVSFLHQQGADIRIWNNLNAYNWSPLLIAQGYRRGNFKPSYATIEAIEAVMAAEGVTLRYDPPGPKVGYDN